MWLPYRIYSIHLLFINLCVCACTRSWVSYLFKWCSMTISNVLGFGFCSFLSNSSINHYVWFVFGRKIDKITNGLVFKCVFFLKFFFSVQSTINLDRDNDHHYAVKNFLQITNTSSCKATANNTGINCSASIVQNSNRNLQNNFNIVELEKNQPIGDLCNRSDNKTHKQLEKFE